MYRDDKISIHAPVKGATGTGTGTAVVDTDFNPRTREGCDGCRVHRHLVKHISIHAPVKGATVSRTTPNIIPVRFQSTHP